MRWKTPPNYSGMVFGRLTVTETTASMQGHLVWLCKCACGSLRVIRGSHLRDGAKSCGCLRNTPPNKRHGHTSTRRKSRTYMVWQAMLARCENPKEKRWHRYGGRGISVCKRWHSFDNFLADMGEAPTGLAIERINNDGSYEPSNCRWAMQREQARNRCTNHFITHNGKTQCLTDWAVEIGVSSATLGDRLKKGMSVEAALTVPRGKRDWKEPGK